MPRTPENDRRACRRSRPLRARGDRATAAITHASGVPWRHTAVIFDKILASIAFSFNPSDACQPGGHPRSNVSTVAFLLHDLLRCGFFLRRAHGLVRSATFDLVGQRSTFHGGDRSSRLYISCSAVEGHRLRGEESSGGKFARCAWVRLRGRALFFLLGPCRRR